MARLKTTLTLPVTPEALAPLELGTVVYLTRRINTGRGGGDKLAVEGGRALPSDMGTASFHCSPAASVNPDGSYTVGAVTATASFRFAQWLDGWFKMSGCNIIIGKGGIALQTYRDQFVANNAIYLTTA